MRKTLKRFLLIILCLAALGTTAVFVINGYVKSVGRGRMLTAAEAAQLSDVDCIIVLGCQVREDGNPSLMLRDRLMRCVELYREGVSPKLLMSGDHGGDDYNEVDPMKKYAVENGVPSEDVFMDHAGFSTYDSMYRAAEIFGAERVIVVTQGYHLYRALYIAEKLGLDAYGVSCDYAVYSGQSLRDLREVLARCKDFAKCIRRPEPTYLGEEIPISGSGDITNDI